jgi:hypothetical protein
MIASYGGPTLDVSDNGGHDWTRLFDAGVTALPSSYFSGFVADTAQETLWWVTGNQAEAPVWSWFPLDRNAPQRWTTGEFTPWDFSFTVAATDPSDPHAIYVGGVGRFGTLSRLGGGDGGVAVDTEWSITVTGPQEAGRLYGVNAIWPDADRPGHVLFGGDDGSHSPALFESTDRGRSPEPISFEGNHAEGTVQGIGVSPDAGTLLVLALLPGPVPNSSPVSIGVYVLAR